jgi:hypothetical protein
LNYSSIDNTNSDYLSMNGNIIYTGDFQANLIFSDLKSFIITGYDYDAKTFTLNSVSGLSVGDTYSTACTGSYYYDYGTITKISGTTVTVSEIPNASFGSYLNYSTPTYNHMCWFIKSKPRAGTYIMLKTGTSNFIMTDESKIYNGGNSLLGNYFNRSHYFAFGKGLILPANSTYTTPTFKIGQYDNDASGGYPFLIGWGSSDTDRKNIFYINNSGQAYAGSVYPNTQASTTNYIGSSGNKWDYGYIINMNTTTTFLNNSWSTLPSDTSQRALLYKNYYNTSVGDIDAITTPGLYTLRTGITGGPYCSSTGSNGSQATSYFTVLCMATDNGSSYRPMIGIKENDNNLYVKGSTSGAWKRIGWGYGTDAPSGTANTGDIYIQYE